MSKWYTPWKLDEPIRQYTPMPEYQPMSWYTPMSSAMETTVPQQEREAAFGESPVGRGLCERAARLRQQWQDEAKLAEAGRLFRQAVECFPNLWEAHYGFGEYLLFRANRAKHAQMPAGSLFADALREVTKAVQLDRQQPEPLLALAGHLAMTNTVVAEHYYTQAVHAHESRRAPLYPKNWQAGNHWQFAIGAAEHDRGAVAVDAFCRAIRLREDYYAGKVMPDLRKANAVWQVALRRLGKTEWFEQQAEEDRKLLAGAFGVSPGGRAMEISECRLERGYTEFGVFFLPTKGTKYGPVSPPQVCVACALDVPLSNIGNERVFDLSGQLPLEGVLDTFSWKIRVHMCRSCASLRLPIGDFIQLKWRYPAQFVVQIGNPVVAEAWRQVLNRYLERLIEFAEKKTRRPVSAKSILRLEEKRLNPGSADWKPPLKDGWLTRTWQRISSRPGP